MAQPVDARDGSDALQAAFPLPRPETLRTAAAAPALSLRPVARDDWAAPSLRWDGHPEDMDWTLAAMAALRGPGAALVRTVPRDIANWCPGYEAAGRASGGRSGRGWSRRWPGTRAPIARRRWAAAGAGSGWCRSRRRRRATGDAPRRRGRRFWTGRPTCAAVCGSWGRRCRATASCPRACAAWRRIGARSIRRASARTCGNGWGSGLLPGGTRGMRRPIMRPQAG
jgi:hypothetical protein